MGRRKVEVSGGEGGREGWAEGGGGGEGGRRWDKIYGFSLWSAALLFCEHCLFLGHCDALERVRSVFGKCPFISMASSSAKLVCLD